MKVLVVVDADYKLDNSMLENVTHQTVTKNSVNQDGISVFQCGKSIPREEWDWVALIGNCMFENELTIDIQIPLDGDPLGELVSAIMAVQEGQDTDEAIGE